jgi:hypothetical protein
MNWKAYGRKRWWPNLRYFPGIFLEGLRNTMYNLYQDRRSPGRNWNPRPSEYEAGRTTKRQRRSVPEDYTVLQPRRPVSTLFTAARTSSVRWHTYSSQSESFIKYILGNHYFRQFCWHLHYNSCTRLISNSLFTSFLADKLLDWNKLQLLTGE